MTDYHRPYDLESYLFSTLQERFQAEGRLSAFGLFCIVTWKANRAKSRAARRLLAKRHQDLEAAVQELAATIAAQPTPRRGCAISGRGGA